jgi:hypothetical protein
MPLVLCRQKEPRESDGAKQGQVWLRGFAPPLQIPVMIPVSEFLFTRVPTLCLSACFAWKVRWHPFFLNPDAPKEGVRKSDFYKAKFGPVQYERVISRMAEVSSCELALG